MPSKINGSIRHGTIMLKIILFFVVLALIIYFFDRPIVLEPIERDPAALALESVRRLQAGLQSFLSMRRIEARRKNASAFRLRHSQSLAKRRQRLSHAMVRSTIQRLGKTANPLT
jgi:hypothetical protein